MLTHDRIVPLDGLLMLATDRDGIDWTIASHVVNHLVDYRTAGAVRMVARWIGALAARRPNVAARWLDALRQDIGTRTPGEARGKAGAAACLWEMRYMRARGFAYRRAAGGAL